MKGKRNLFRLFATLGLAVAAGYLNYQWMTGRSGELMAQAPQVAKVCVAMADLAVGTKLDRSMIRLAEYPVGSIPAKSFADPAALEGRVLVATVYQNEPVLESRLASPDITIGGVHAMIAPGKRAMAVKGNEVLGLSGLVGPGNKVDVLVTLKSEVDGNKPATKLVLEQVPVLATGTVLEHKAGKDAMPVDVYTLEVTPEEGEVLALASTLGTLHFAMRNQADKETVLTEGANLKKTLASYSPERPPAKLARAPRYKAVEIIAGGTSSTVKFAR